MSEKNWKISAKVFLVTFVSFFISSQKRLHLVHLPFLDKIVLNPKRQTIHHNRYQNYHQNQLQSLKLFNPAQYEVRYCNNWLAQSILDVKHTYLYTKHNYVPNQKLYEPIRVGNSIFLCKKYIYLVFFTVI